MTIKTELQSIIAAFFGVDAQSISQWCKTGTCVFPVCALGVTEAGEGSGDVNFQPAEFWVSLPLFPEKHSGEGLTLRRIWGRVGGTGRMEKVAPFLQQELIDV
jgi:hypothetical protein